MRVSIGDVWFDESIVAEIRDCMCERCVVKRLAAVWGGEYEVDYGWIRVDIVVKGTAIEVKLNAREYDGIGQALAYKKVLEFEDVSLLHVQQACERTFIERLSEIVKGLPLSVVVVDIEREKIVLVEVAPSVSENSLHVFSMRQF